MNAEVEFNDRLKPCHQDLNRLIPKWLAMSEDEQEWQIQRFIDKLLKQPDLLNDFCGALLQRVAGLESQLEPVDQADYSLSRTLWLNLNLLKDNP